MKAFILRLLAAFKAFWQVLVGDFEGFEVEMAQLYGESALAHGKLMLACVKNSQGKPWINADGEQVEGKPFSKITGIKPLPADGVVTAPQKTTTVMKPAPKKEVAAQPDDFDL